ncbi:YgdI/YgdR family lipoprotein [Sulfurovum riftiae]|nr:YgdI/YgdR family lipoprotein [Sulfurovum riftiae]
MKKERIILAVLMVAAVFLLTACSTYIIPIPIPV